MEMTIFIVYFGTTTFVLTTIAIT